MKREYRVARKTSRLSFLSVSKRVSRFRKMGPLRQKTARIYYKSREGKGKMRKQAKVGAKVDRTVLK